MSQPLNYINNADFYKAICEYQTKYKDAVANDEKLPIIPNYIGECIMKIANKLSYSNNGKMSFINYTYRDEMVEDAIENCIKAIHSFNPEVTSNPFSYFTQICFFAFLRRIATERKQTYIKNKMIVDTITSSYGLYDQEDSDDTHSFKNEFLEYMNLHQNFDDSMYTKPTPKKRVKTKQSYVSLYEFSDHEDELDAKE